jgi:hypothetical protein
LTQKEFLLLSKLDNVLSAPGVIGPTGPSGGPPGLTGNTRATGATSFTASGLQTRGFFYSTADGIVAPGALLPLDTTGAGMILDLILAGNTITIVTPGIYQVTYYYNPAIQDPVNLEADVQLQLNGVPVGYKYIFLIPYHVLGLCHLLKSHLSK